jgi:hypothetical protein
MADPPAWFRALVTCELVFQLPIFFVAIHGYVTRMSEPARLCMPYQESKALAYSRNTWIIAIFVYAPARRQ